MIHRWHVALLGCALLCSCASTSTTPFSEESLGISLSYPKTWNESQVSVSEVIEAMARARSSDSDDWVERYGELAESFGIQLVLNAEKPKSAYQAHRPASVTLLAMPIPIEALEPDGSCDGAAASQEALQGMIEGMRDTPPSVEIEVSEAPSLSQLPGAPGLRSTIRANGIELHRRTYLFLSGGFLVDLTMSWSDPGDEPLVSAIARSVRFAPIGDRCVWPAIDQGAAAH